VVGPLDPGHDRDPQFFAGGPVPAVEDAQTCLATGRETPAGDPFTTPAGENLLRRAGVSSRIYADDLATSRRRDLTVEEERAFWAWAIVEVLRHTGMRIEEALELTHHSFVAY
jgi:hypothetical protein